jgi:hypothetical protein
MRSSFPRKKDKEEASARMLTKIARTDLPQNVSSGLPYACFRGQHNVKCVTATKKHRQFSRFLAVFAWYSTRPRKSGTIGEDGQARPVTEIPWLPGTLFFIGMAADRGRWA